MGWVLLTGISSTEPGSRPARAQAASMRARAAARFAATSVMPKPYHARPDGASRQAWNPQGQRAASDSTAREANTAKPNAMPV